MCNGLQYVLWCHNATIEQFLLICERLIYKWKQVQFQYDFRNDRRAPGPSDSSRAAPMATEVGEHCEGCGKPNHKRKDCISGQYPKHPDFNDQDMVGLPRSRRRAPDPAIQLSRRWNTTGAQA